MNIEELIDQLKDLKEKHGNLEVKLITQDIKGNWEDHDIHVVCFFENEVKKHRGIMIKGKDKPEAMLDQF